MKTKVLKTISMAVSLIVAMGTVLTAEAITWKGELGESVMSRQIWNATCPKNTDQAHFKISNQGNVIAALGKNGDTVVETADDVFIKEKVITALEAKAKVANKIAAPVDKDWVTLIETNNGLLEFGDVTQGSGIYTLVIFKDVEKETKGVEPFEAEVICSKAGLANSDVDPIINLQLFVK
jgi:hypothetical protein